MASSSPDQAANQRDSAPQVDPELLEILVCPVDHGALDHTDDRLSCTVCGRVFPIEDGIPNMLVSEAE